MAGFQMQIAMLKRDLSTTLGALKAAKRQPHQDAYMTFLAVATLSKSEILPQKNE